MLNPRNMPRWGTDPEGFFKRGNQIVGSEKFIPYKGVSNYSGRVTRDGVQFEMQPRSGADRSELGSRISALFGVVNDRVLKPNPDVSICFDGLVEVSEQELASLSADTRRLGCMPSFNIYGVRPITVDPMIYRKRSAGGHIHTGTTDKAFMKNRDLAVYAYDIIVGQTCVLLDRDPGAAERRENYGRAGEYRTPDHGLEYRTTSNFWLRDFTLLDLTFGLAHIAYDIAFQNVNGDKTLWNELSDRVDIALVQKAIDTNDAKLALKNFKKIAPFLRKQLPKEGFVLTPKNISDFIEFTQQPIEKRFPTDQIVSNWISGQQTEFTEYLERA